MARAIFRSWFVDFDPVVAKAAGRQPFGMSADVAALFPERFVESMGDSIRLGWLQIGAADARRLQHGNVLRATERTLRIYPVVSAERTKGHALTGSDDEVPVLQSDGKRSPIGCVFFIHGDFLGGRTPRSYVEAVSELESCPCVLTYCSRLSISIAYQPARICRDPHGIRITYHNLPVVVPPKGY